MAPSSMASRKPLHPIPCLQKFFCAWPRTRKGTPNARISLVQTALTLHHIQVPARNRQVYVIYFPHPIFSLAFTSGVSSHCSLRPPFFLMTNTFRLGSISSPDELEELWAIDKSAYGAASIPFENFLEWWRAILRACWC